MIHHKQMLVAAVSMCFTAVIPDFASAAPIIGQGTWETTLHGRDLDGNPATFEAYYDTVLDITWLADANYAMTSGYDADGRMAWADAKVWTENLNPYGSGVTGWRLPTLGPVDGSTADDAATSYIGNEDRTYNVSAPGSLFAGSTASHMAYLFYNTLGNKAYCDLSTSTVSTCNVVSGWGLTNTGPFTNLQAGSYWSTAEFVPYANNAWGFHFNYGYQTNFAQAGELYAWAVYEGDVGAALVPVPAAAWLLVSGLLGLVGGTTRQKAVRKQGQRAVGK